MMIDGNSLQRSWPKLSSFTDTFTGSSRIFTDSMFFTYPKLPLLPLDFWELPLGGTVPNYQRNL